MNEPFIKTAVLYKKLKHFNGSTSYLYQYASKDSTFDSPILYGILSCFQKGNHTCYFYIYLIAMSGL